MAEARHESGSGWRGHVALALLALWGLSLIVAYVAAQPSGALSFARAFEAAAAAPSDGPGLVVALGAALRAILVAVAILASAIGFGSLISSLGLGSLGLGPWPDRCAELMLGSGVLAVAVFGLGHAGLMTIVPAALLIAAGWVALIVSIRNGLRSREPDPGFEPSARALDPVVIVSVAGIAVALLLALVTALAPPTARDALAYHLAAPKAYIAANGIVELPWSVHTYLPFATEMLFTLGLLVGPDASPNLVHLGLGVAVVVLVVVTTLRVTHSPRWAATAGLVFASVPSVIWNAGIAHNEMWMALAVSIAALAVGRWWETGEARLLVWTGAAVGVALAAKHTALLLAPILAIVVLLRIRTLPKHDQSRTFLGAVGAGCVALAFPLPWYAQNIARTGNPLFPYFWNLFPTHSPVWDAPRAEVFEAYLRLSYGQHDGVLSWLRLPWDVSVRAQNDVTSLFDGVVGPVFLFVAPLLIVGLRRSGVPDWLRIAAAVAIASAAIWPTQSQQIRFLVPILPVLTIAGIAAIADISAWWPSRRVADWTLSALLSGMVALSLSIAAIDVLSAAPHRAVFGLESQESYLRRRLAYFPFYERLNRELGPQDRVLLVNMRNDGYYLDVPFVSDSVLEDYSVGRIANGAASAEAVRDAVRGLGITHVLVREDILLDPRFTPFDDARAAARWTGFLEAHARRLEARDGTALYALKN